MVWYLCCIIQFTRCWCLYFPLIGICVEVKWDVNFVGELLCSTPRVPQVQRQNGERGIWSSCGHGRFCCILNAGRLRCAVIMCTIVFCRYRYVVCGWNSYVTKCWHSFVMCWRFCIGKITEDALLYIQCKPTCYYFNFVSILKFINTADIWFTQFHHSFICCFVFCQSTLFKKIFFTHLTDD